VSHAVTTGQHHTCQAVLIVARKSQYHSTVIKYLNSGDVAMVWISDPWN